MISGLNKLCFSNLNNFNINLVNSWCGFLAGDVLDERFWPGNILDEIKVNQIEHTMYIFITVYVFWSVILQYSYVIYDVMDRVGV